MSFPKRIVICRCGFILMVVAHLALLVAEFIPHGQTHNVCKQVGYALLLAIVLFRGVKAALVSPANRGKKKQKKVESAVAGNHNPQDADSSRPS